MNIVIVNLNPAAMDKQESCAITKMTAQCALCNTNISMMQQ